MSKTIITAAVSAVALALAPFAAAQADELVSNPRGMVENFDAANIGPLLTELGLTWQQRQSKEGQSFIAASVGPDFAFMIYPSACAGADGHSECAGAHYLAIFEGDEANRQTVTAFNQAFPFTSAGVTGSGKAYISRYEIADYGIPRGNVVSSLSSFLYLADRLENELASGAKTVSQQGQADDMAARFLNGKSAEAIGIVKARNVSFQSMHRAAFEEAANIVRVLENQERAPKNKIKNLTERQ